MKTKNGHILTFSEKMQISAILRFATCDWFCPMTSHLRFFNSMCCFRLHFFYFNVLFKKKKLVAVYFSKNKLLCKKREKKITCSEEKSQPPPPLYIKWSVPKSFEELLVTNTVNQKVMFVTSASCMLKSFLIFQSVHECKIFYHLVSYNYIVRKKIY